MHEDELRAECRAKLALIIDGGHLLRCPTRTKAFGFIKTVMRNHVRSLVQKFAFSQKRWKSGCLQLSWRDICPEPRVRALVHQALDCK